MTAEFAAVNNDAAHGLARGLAIRIESAINRVERSNTATRHAKKSAVASKQFTHDFGTSGRLLLIGSCRKGVNNIGDDSSSRSAYGTGFPFPLLTYAQVFNRVTHNWQLNWAAPIILRMVIATSP